MSFLASLLIAIWSLIAWPFRWLNGLFSSAKPQVQDPGAAEPNSRMFQPSQEQAQEPQSALSWDLALSVRSAARALIRGEQPIGLTAPHVAWLRSMDTNTIQKLAALPPADVLDLLKGRERSGIVPYSHESAMKMVNLRTMQSNLLAMRSPGLIAPQIAVDPAVRASEWHSHIESLAFPRRSPAAAGPRL